MKKGIAIVMLLAAAAMAADLSGKWSGTFKVDGGDHTVPQLFILKQQGKTLTGSGGPNAGEQYPIENGRVEGSEIKFELTTGEWKFEYALKQTQDGLAGDLKLTSVGDNRTAKVTLARLQQ
jgi:opacity protein-like surface antigen